MPRANLKLNIAFGFELQAPEGLLGIDHESLCKAMREILGTMVLQGLPTITGKQLAKAGIAIVSHHHHLDAVNTVAADIPREVLVAAAPHLTDDELVQLARRVQGRAPASADEQLRFLRRQALALVGDFRMVGCVVKARLVAGNDAELDGKLNLTNGSVLLGERARQNRLQANQGPLRIEVGAAGIQVGGECAGHTLSGPVIEVGIAELARHRDALIAAWQGQPS